LADASARFVVSDSHHDYRCRMGRHLPRVELRTCLACLLLTTRRLVVGGCPQREKFSWALFACVTNVSAAQLVALTAIFFNRFAFPFLTQYYKH